MVSCDRNIISGLYPPLRQPALHSSKIYTCNCTILWMNMLCQSLHAHVSIHTCTCTCTILWMNKPWQKICIRPYHLHVWIADRIKSGGPTNVKQELEMHRIKVLWLLSGIQMQIYLCSNVTVEFWNHFNPVNCEMSILFTGQTTDRQQKLTPAVHACEG